jgi:putative transposase
LKDLEKAYKNFLAKRADFPRFKRKGHGESFRYPDPKQIKLDQVNSRLFLPKLGWLHYRNSREVLSELRNVTVSQSGGKWFVSIQTRREVEQPVPPDTAIVGIDLGIARFATLSSGCIIEPLNTLRKHQIRLAKYQRRMSRKQKFRHNWQKAKSRVQKIHSRIANARRDFLHKATTTISKNDAIVVLEELRVRKMSKSAADHAEHPGRNVRAKSGLNKSILDQGWIELRRQLEYKQAWLGGEVLAVSPRDTSRTCPNCRHVSAENRLTQA